jgi:excisionase family DNA binding protein
MSNDDSGRLLKAEEIRDRYGLSRTTIFELRRAGELPEVRFGRAVRFRVEDVEALVAARVARYTPRAQ